MRLPREDFEHLVAEAIAGLPPEFAGKLDNVEFIIEEAPGPQDYAAVGRGGVLLAIYRGVPLTQRSVFATGTLPDQIVIFQRPIERMCRTSAQIIREVRRTVLHEIAHHFGISDERLRELGY